MPIIVSGGGGSGAISIPNSNFSTGSFSTMQYSFAVTQLIKL